MSRLGNILKAIIAPFGKTLWTGTWSSGSITVPDSDKYSAFIITMEGYGLIGVMNGPRTFVSGFNIATGTGSPQYMRIVGIDVNGTTWTKRYFSSMAHNGSGNHAAAVTDKSVVSIVGLVPYFGGGYYLTALSRLLERLVPSPRGGVVHE